MYYTIFEAIAQPGKGKIAEAMYVDLLPKVKEIPGFIDDTFLEATHTADKGVDISQWKNPGALSRWRNEVNHLRAQGKGPNIYQSYRIRIGPVVEASESGFEGDAKHWVVLYYRDSVEEIPADDITSLLQEGDAVSKAEMLDSVVYQGPKTVWISSWSSHDAAESLRKAIPRVNGDEFVALAIERDYTKTERREDAPSKVAGESHL